MSVADIPDATRMTLAVAAIQEWDRERKLIQPIGRAEFDLDRLDLLSFVLTAPAADLVQYLDTTEETK